MRNKPRRASPGRIFAILVTACLAGCDGGGEATSGGPGGGGEGGAGGAGGAGAGGEATALRALHVKVALTEGPQGVEVPAQNGATAYVPAASLIGKTVWWATAPAGVSVSSTTPIEFGSTTMGDDLTAEYETPASYADGPWEMALFISVAGEDPLNGPQPGDLAAFDNSPPPEGQPPVTGSSVRMTIDGADASISLDNEYFVEF